MTTGGKAVKFWVCIIRIMLCIAKDLKLRVVFRENYFWVETLFVIRNVVGDGIKAFRRKRNIIKYNIIKKNISNWSNNYSMVSYYLYKVDLLHIVFLDTL